MKSSKTFSKRLVLCLCAVLCTAPLFCQAESALVTMPYAQLEIEARENALCPLEPLGNEQDAVIDGVVYGYGIRRFQTWFEVGDAALWACIGRTPPQGILTWAEWVELSEAVEAYNRQHAEPIWLLATQAQRFPGTFLPIEQADIRAQWNAMQPIVCQQSQNPARVLLWERVVSIDQIGYNTYVTGIEHGAQVYRLAQPETRYAAIRRDTDNAAQAQATLLSDVKRAACAQTGFVPEGMTYAECCEVWNVNVPEPSESNFRLWTQMTRSAVR